MKVGYVRVSTIGQNTARQEVLMQELGVERVLVDRQSGKDTGRPELQRLIASWRNGEMTAVEAMQRLQISKTTFYRRVNQTERRERP